MSEKLVFVSYARKEPFDALLRSVSWLTVVSGAKATRR
jgi:hypothetical protein